MPEVNNTESMIDGRAYVASWIVKMLAGAFLAAGLAWGSSVSTTSTLHSNRLTQLETNMVNEQKQLDRIEAKVDRLIEIKETK